jgi:hypothetical protein
LNPKMSMLERKLIFIPLFVTFRCKYGDQCDFSHEPTY